MKKILFSIICFLSCVSVHAQVLFGTTSYGGSEGTGSIHKFIPATNDLTVVKSFERPPSRPYYTNFIQASNGKLYGMTSNGGKKDLGVIFSFEPSSGEYKKLNDFDSVNGAHPNGSLVQAGNGKLYGMTTDGGSNDVGVIFSFDPFSSSLTKVKDFNYEDGAHPHGSLLQASDGKLYGMTTDGGSNGSGIIFSFDPAFSIYTKLKDLDLASGSLPYGSLIQASDGKLYGMTEYGGNSEVGVIFSFDPANSIYTKLMDFYDELGASPYGSLMQASDGKLYGVTSDGGTIFGVIFSFDPTTSLYTRLKVFDESLAPFGSLIQANDGKLYGLTSQRPGFSPPPVIFSIDPSTLIYTELRALNGSSQVTGFSPFGSLMQAGDGKLYGMMSRGGSYDGGVIFSFDLPSSRYRELKSITSNETGSNVLSSLVQAGNQILYGTTSGGGSNGYGVIFSFDPYSSSYRKLKDFDGTDGAYPAGNLIQAKNGKLYGMTVSGGSKGYGVIFSFDPLLSIFTKVKDFDYSDGASPHGSLVQGSNGKLYGMTTSGYSSYGVIFSFDAYSSAYQKLKNFDGVDGAYPYGSLVQAKNGKLYGMTLKGGNTFDDEYGGSGVVFSFDPASSSYTKVVDFDYANGASPYGSLVEAGDGKLYGVTSKGGNEDIGVIFSFDPSSSTFTKLKDINSNNGENPSGSLIQAIDGKLYGTATAAYSTTSTIFSFDPSTSDYTKLKDFDGVSNEAFIEIKGCVTGTKYYRDADGDGYGDPAIFVTECPLPPGYVANNRDCNDLPLKGGAAIYPGAREVCNGTDDDCDGLVDSWTLEAEKADLSGAIAASDAPGFTGSGYADYQNASKDYVEWTVDASSAGEFLMQFRYANGGTQDRPLQLLINDVPVIASLSFSPTGAWTNWSVSSASVSLFNGINKVRLIARGSNGPNIDNLTVKFIDCMPGMVEAEQAVLNGAIVAAKHPGYTGYGYADYQNAGVDYIEWTVNDSVAGSYSLQLRYANGTNAYRHLKLEVNGIVVAADLAFSPTGSWETWADLSATANLIAGTNKIRLTAIGSSGPNVDHLIVSLNNSIQTVAQKFVSKTSQLPLPGIFNAYIAPNPVEGSTARLILSTSSNLPINLQLVDLLGRSYKSFKTVLRGSNIIDFPVKDVPPERTRSYLSREI